MSNGRNDKSSSSDRKERRGAFSLLLQMIVNTVGIYACFGMWSIQQERVMTKPYTLPNGEEKVMQSFLMVGLLQAIAGVVVGVVVLCVMDAYNTLGNIFRGTKASTPNVSHRPHAQSGKGSFFWIIRQLLAMSFTNTFGASFGYLSMRFVSFPVVLCTKMSKMMPVMIVGALWHGTRYSLAKYLLCISLTIGILMFTFAEVFDGSGDSNKASGAINMESVTWVPSMSVAIGLGLLITNLFADGFTNSTQDVLVKVCGWGGNSLMILTNLFSAMWFAVVLALLEVALPVALVLIQSVVFDDMSSDKVGTPPHVYREAALQHLNLLQTGANTTTLASTSEGGWVWSALVKVPFNDLSNTMTFFRQQPQVLQDVVMMSVLNACGQVFVFNTIHLFGTLTLTAMTLIRKCGSVLLSIFVHDHRLSATQWAALGIVFVGVVGECIVNIREKSSASSKQNSPSSSIPPSNKAHQSAGKQNAHNGSNHPSKAAHNNNGGGKKQHNSNDGNNNNNNNNKKKK